jgi:hypothetical protein
VNAVPADSATPRQPGRDKPSFAIPLIVWLLIQLTAIALAASGVALSASFPNPPQRLAVHEMLVAQFVGSAMFAALLFRGGWRGWLALVVSAAPMLMLAGWLARMPMSRVSVLWVNVGAWLTMLALWSAVGRNHSKARGSQFPGFQSTLTALAMLLSAGGLLLWYLQAEFQPVRNPTWLRLFPMPALLEGAATPSGPHLALPLLSTVVLSVAALVILAVKASDRRPDARGPVR